MTNLMVALMASPTFQSAPLREGRWHDTFCTRLIQNSFNPRPYVRGDGPVRSWIWRQRNIVSIRAPT